MALCSLSTGRMATPRLPRRGGHERARHDQHFLVGQRDRLARLDRGQHRLEPRGARGRADHDVDGWMRGDGDQALGAGTDARAGATRRPP